MSAHPSQSILFELLRSYTTLARTLNLSHAVDELRSTRQTVRRHIAQLEEMRGEQLFQLTDRQYQLTPAGREALPGALELLAHAQAWIDRQVSYADGLFSISYEENPNFDYFLQQHPVDYVFLNGSAVMKRAVEAWALSGGDLEHDCMSTIRDYALIYRSIDDAWYMTEIGLQSSFATWFGWAAARSNIGSPVSQLPGGHSFGKLLEYPLKIVHQTRGLWYDHVHTQIPREFGGAPCPISYQRLMMGCHFPDGTFALVSIIERTNDILLGDASLSKVQLMPEELVMNFSDHEPKLKAISG